MNSLAPNTQLELAKLILEYLRVIIWPVAVIIIGWPYRKYLHRLFDRFSTDAKEVRFGSLSIITETRQIAQNMALAEAAAATPIAVVSATSPPASTSQPSSAPLPTPSSTLALQQVRLLADIFFSKPFKERQGAAYEVQQFARLLRLVDIVALANSPLPGERVASGIALRERLLEYPEEARDDSVRAAIANGLSDTMSRVRYRFIRAAEASKELRELFRESLSRIATHDSDAVVRKEAGRILNTS